MKPPVLSVRRPVDPDAAAAFLSGQSYPAPRAVPPLPAPSTGPEAPDSAAPPAAAPAAPLAVEAQAPAPGPALPGRRVHERKDGRRVRRTTVLMREELARRLDLFAAGRGVDKTAVYEAALEAYLAAQGG